MRVSVFGLGYVGAVSCGCFANDGLDVIGVDVSPGKVSMLSDGQSPIIESGIGELIREGVKAGRLRATHDVEDAVHNSDVSVVSVGTPSEANGNLSMAAVQRVCEQIGRAMARKVERHLVVVRSTILPGSTRDVVVPCIERTSGKQCGEGFGVCFNPEFLREGSSVADYYSPPYTLIGSRDHRDGEKAALMYAKVEAPVHLADVETAEMVKYVSNAFHALKITFANEVGALAHPLGIDSQRVMELVCQDTKLNISSRYLTPGFAFGGSCLPKDLRALLYRARTVDVELPVIRSIVESNRRLIERTVQEVLGLKRRKVGLLGLSFKAGTDDLRESPLVTLSETLLGKGLDIRIFDEEVSMARLVGANREYINKEIPHLSSLLLPDLSQVVSHAEVVIIGNGSPVFRELPRYLRPGQVVVDLVRLPEVERFPEIDYRGIAW